MDLPEEVVQQLQDIKSALDDVDEHLQPFLEAGPKEINAQLTPLERLKAHLALAQAAVVLYSLDRQLAAAKLDNSHPLQKELERLSKYERKVAEAVAADDLVRTRPGASLNIAAANRFIDAAIPDLSKEQKAALRRLHKQQPAAAAEAAAAVADTGNGSSEPCEEDEGPAAACDKSGGSSSGVVSNRKRPKQQQQQQQHKKRPKESEVQDFLQEVVAEADRQQQQQQQQPTNAAAAAEAEAFVLDVLASLEKEDAEQA